MMRTAFLHRIPLGCLAAIGCAGSQHNPGRIDRQPASSETKAIEPFFNARSQTAEYAGPGRDDPPPSDLKEVKIGWFGPSDADHPTAGAMWGAAQMAVEEANATGGYNGLKFRLVPVWSEDPWGTGIKGLIQLVYAEGVWALVGAPDGPSAHLAAQVVAKARVVFLSPVATDKTANLANVPWIFSCAPGDHLTAPALAPAVVNPVTENEAPLRPAAQQEPPKATLHDVARFAVVSCTDHDSRMFVTELLAALKQLGTFPTLHLHFQPDAAKFDTQLDLLQTAQPAAIALIAGPADAARFLVTLRTRGLAIPVFGDPRMGHRLFLETAGPGADGATFPLLWSPQDDDRTVEFTSCFTDRFGFEPDYTAAHTYDAMMLLITAVHKAGLNRARIRDAVRDLSSWSGVSGSITWDPPGHNHRAVCLGTVRNAQLILADH